jgi:hypothetical protein
MWAGSFSPAGYGKMIGERLGEFIQRRRRDENPSLWAERYGYERKDSVMTKMAPCTKSGRDGRKAPLHIRFLKSKNVRLERTTID